MGRRKGRKGQQMAATSTVRDLRSKYELLSDLTNIMQLLAKMDCQVIAVVGDYYLSTADFKTFVWIKGDPKAGITEDHALLDMLRELMVQWHNHNHNTLLEFKRQPESLIETSPAWKGPYPVAATP